MKKIIVSLSGGIDSTVTLALAIQQGYECLPVIFRYGSKHGFYENNAAVRISTYYKILPRFINLEVMKNFKSNLMKDGGDIPEGHYEDKNMNQTVVPSRNIIFISILSGLAWSIGAEAVWIGIHGGDHIIYPDCRPEFYYAMKRAIELGTNERIELVAPFLPDCKTYIIQKGVELKVPFELTRTCYKEQELACGKCGSCIERLEAFSLNGIKDPIKYED